MMVQECRQSMKWNHNQHNRSVSRGRKKELNTRLKRCLCFQLEWILTVNLRRFKQHRGNKHTQIHIMKTYSMKSRLQITNCIQLREKEIKRGQVLPIHQSFHWYSQVWTLYVGDMVSSVFHSLDKWFKFLRPQLISYKETTRCFRATKTERKGFRTAGGTVQHLISTSAHHVSRSCRLFLLRT